MKTTARSVRAAMAVAVALAVSACASAGVAAPSAAPSGSALPDATSVATGPGHDFYLRLWQGQALAPRYRLSSLPQVTIADGWFYDGMIAIPAIYPGPIYSGVSRRHITEAGIAEIVAGASTAGLLSGAKTFGQVPPGGVVCNVTIVVAGVPHDLSGACAADNPAAAVSPGTAQAFGGFVAKLQGVGPWLAADLGSSVPWDPDDLVVLAVAPVVDAGGPIAPAQAAWPLAVPFSRFGNPAGSADIRCAVVSGEDLAVLLPAIEAGNALTRYTDLEGIAKSLQARPLLPGEPSPC